MKAITYTAEVGGELTNTITSTPDVFFVVDHIVFLAGPDDTVWRIIYGDANNIPSNPADIDWGSALNLHDDDIWLWTKDGIDRRTRAAHGAVALALTALTGDIGDAAKMQVVEFMRENYDWPGTWSNFEVAK